MANRKILMGALPMIVSAIAGGADVQVVWGNFQTASTDGKRLNMPLLPLEDEAVEDYALGYGIHETGHIVGTDFSVERKPGLAHSLAGILEDVRIEGERMRTLPGARRWLERLAYRLLKDGRLGKADADMSVPNKLVSYLLTHLWYEILDFKGLSEAASKCRDNLAASLPSDVFGALEATAMKVRHARDTAQVVALADELMDVLRSKQDEYQQQAKQQPQPGQQQDAQTQPDQQSGGDEGGQQDQPAAQQPQDGDEDEPEGDGGASSQHPDEDSDEDQAGAQGAAGDSNGDGGESKDDAQSAGQDQDEGDTTADEGSATSDDTGAGSAGEDANGDGAQAQGASGDGQDEQSDEHGGDPGTGGCQGDSDASSQDSAQAQSGQGAGGDSQPSDAPATQQPQQGQPGDQAQGAQDAPGAQAEGNGGDSPALDPAKVAQTLQELVDAGEPEEGGDIGERIAQGLQESLKQAGSKGTGMFTAAPDVHDLTAVLGAPGLIGEVRKQSTAIRARLDEFVQAQTRTRASNAMSGPRLARDAGLRLVTGNMHMYSEPRSRARKVDTAFNVFVDCSISMRGRQIQVAREAALALAVALEQVGGVQLAITAFGGRFGTVTRVMRFGEDLRRTAGRFNQLDAAGSTPMAEALLVGHSDLLVVDAQRYVAVVVTDGEPNDTNATQQVIALGEKLGIEHIAIGIGSEARAAQLFAVSRNISDVGELPSALMGMVREQMFTQRLAA